MLRAAIAKLSRHTLTYAVAEQLGRLAGFLLLPVTTGYLSESEFGTRELLATTLAILAQAAGLNVTAAMSRFYFDTSDESERRRVISTTALSMGGVAAGLALLLGSTARFWAGVLPSDAVHLPRLLQITLGIFFFQMLREVANKVLQTQERSRLYGAFSVAKVLVEIALQIYFLVVLRRGLEGLLWAVLISEASFALLISLVLLPSTGFGFSTRVFAALFAYSLPLIPNGVLQFCLHSADRYLVGGLAGSDALGLYALAYKLGYMPNYLVLGPFLLIWYPFVFSVRDDEQQRRTVGRIAPYFMLLMSAAAVGVALFSKEIVQLAATRPGYHRAGSAIPWVAFGYWLWALYQMLQTGFYASKRTRLLPLLTAVAVVVNVFANLVLIPALGFAGAALATTLTFGILCVATQARVQEVYPVEWPWGRILAPVATGAALAAILLALDGTAAAPHVGTKFAAFAAWGAAACYLGVDGADRRALVHEVRQRVRRRGRA